MHHNGTASRVDWCRKAGRGILSIPAPITSSHWRSRGAPAAMPLSAESAPAVVQCSVPGLYQGGFCLLYISLFYLVPLLPHQEGMIAQPEFGRPMKIRDAVPLDHSGSHPIRPRGPSWVVEGNPVLFGQQTGDHPTGDLCRGPLEEGREEGVPHRILHNLVGHLYFYGDVLYKGPLLMEGLLQACKCGLRVPTRHPGQVFHWILPAFHLIPKKVILRRLGTHEVPKVAASCHYLESVSPENGLRPRDVPGRHNQDALGWFW